MDASLKSQLIMALASCCLYDWFSLNSLPNFSKQNTNTMFGFWRVLRKERKKLRKMIFSYLVYHWECERKSNIIKNLYIYRLFILKTKNKWIEFKEAFKNNLSTLNLFFISIFFPLHFPSNFSRTKYKVKFDLFPINE